MSCRTKNPRFPRTFAALAVATAGLASATPALAQWGDQPDETDWRRQDRPTYQSPQSWAFEVRFGPYKPLIDEEFGAAEGPYERVFGDSNRVYFGMELDYQALRIPHVGTLGPGAAWQFTKMSGTGKLQASGEDSAESTGLWIMPMYLVGVLRVDVFARDFGVPLVPYGKLGVGYAIWKASNELGASTYKTATGSVVGKGHSYGLHYAGGLMLQLDPFERHAAAQLDESMGINHSYVYFEWMKSNLDGFGSGDQMRVGASTWSLGLTFEI